METRAGYIAVGGFVIVLAAAALGFILWLTGSAAGDRPVPYLVYFEGSVTGLQEGGTVRYRGVPVGTVTDIRIDPQNIERIQVSVAVDPQTPIKTDTVATLALQGITGLAYIQLIEGTQESPPLTARDGEEYPVIPSRTTGLQQVVEQVPQVIERIVTVTERVADLLDEKNIGAINETLENLRGLSATVAGRRDDMDKMVTDSREAIDAFRDASEGIRRLTETVAGSVDPIARDAKEVVSQARSTAEEARKAAASFKAVADELAGLVEENRTPIRDFTSSGLYEFSQFVAEARVLVDSLNRLSTQIERDPARFFFGDTQKGFEAR